MSKAVTSTSTNQTSHVAELSLVHDAVIYGLVLSRVGTACCLRCTALRQRTQRGGGAIPGDSTYRYCNLLMLPRGWGRAYPPSYLLYYSVDRYGRSRVLTYRYSSTYRRAGRRRCGGNTRALICWSNRRYASACQFYASCHGLVGWLDLGRLLISACFLTRRPNFFSALSSSIPTHRSPLNTREQLSQPLRFNYPSAPFCHSPLFICVHRLLCCVVLCCVVLHMWLF